MKKSNYNDVKFNFVIHMLQITFLICFVISFVLPEERIVAVFLGTIFYTAFLMFSYINYLYSKTKSIEKHQKTINKREVKYKAISNVKNEMQDFTKYLHITNES